MKNVRMIRRLFLQALAATVVATSAHAVNSVPPNLEDSFESYPIGQVFTNETGGWIAADAVSAVITNLYWTSDPVYIDSYTNISPYPIPAADHSAASQVMRVDGGVTNRVVTPSAGIVWVDMLLQPTRWAEETYPEVDTNDLPHLAMYYASNGFLTAYITTNLSLSYPNAQGWLELPNTFAASGTWQRISLKLDFLNSRFPYGQRYFEIYANGNVISNEFGFSDNTAFFGAAEPDGGSWFAMSSVSASNMQAFAIRNTANLDDFRVATNSPFGGVTFPIAASSGGNGLIDPSGTVNVQQGFNQKFNFLPNSGYAVKEYVVDGATNAGPAASYTFTDVQAAHTIHVNFELSGAGNTVTQGVPVAWLLGYGLDGTDAAALDNPDGDPHETWKEFWAGTNPTNKYDYFHFIGQTFVGDELVLSWLGGTNGATNDFQIWCTTNLLQPNAWTNIANWPRSPTGTNYWTNAAPAPRSIYEIVVPVLEQ